jgi:hypothetical protein
MKPMNTSIVPLTGSVTGFIRTVVLTLAVTSFTLAPKSFADERIIREAGRARSSLAPVENAKPDEKTNPLPAGESLKKGIDYLLQQQQPDGGWGQGGGWRQNVGKGGGRVEGKEVEDPSDLGNTAVSFVTLLRAGHTPASGEHRGAMAKAFDFICRYVEKADEESLFVTPVRDTQLQTKIGVYVDTFLTGWALSEAKGKVGDEAAEKRRAAALDKVVKKIEKHQKEDGSFAGNAGWAAVLSQGLCSKALNGAARSGAKVSKAALDKDQRQNLAGLDIKKGDFTASTTVTGGVAAEPSSAGVSLYREGAKLGGLWENNESNKTRRIDAEKVIADPAAPAPKKAEAQAELKKADEDQQAAQVALKAVAGKLGNAGFVAGFGNNGGEEFLSYLNVSESMKAQGGKEWDGWKPKMIATITGAQNADGSWAGHHCITGRTFCTSAALLTLLVDRAPAATITAVTPPKSETATP